MREACEEVASDFASDFACDFPLLPEEVELDFSSSRFARVPVDGLTGSASSSLALSPRLERLLSLGVLDSNEGWDCWKIGRKKNASAGPRPQHRRSGACACESSIVGMNELLIA